MRLFAVLNFLWHVDPDATQVIIESLSVGCVDDLIGRCEEMQLKIDEETVPTQQQIHMYNFCTFVQRAASGTVEVVEADVIVDG